MRVAVLGLARNCAQTIPIVMESIANWGVPTQVIIGEDGSTDATRRVIESYAELVDTTLNAPSVPRLARMARARQLVKRHYENTANADLVIVMDMDADFAARIDATWLHYAYGRLYLPDAPFALSATSRPYYDLLAFESDTKSFVGLDERIESAKKKPSTYRRFKQIEIYAEQLSLTRDTEISCISAFNGVAVYADPVFRRGTYQPPGETAVCEHLLLHRGLASDGSRMVVDPSLQVPAPREHVKQSALSFYASAARKLLRR